MWRILFLNICLASLKFLFAEDFQIAPGQDVTGQLKYLPAVLAPSPYAQPIYNFSTGILGIKSSEVPVGYNRINGQIAQPQSLSDNCPQLEILQNILLLLKRLLNQDDNSYDLQPSKRIQILETLNKYLENSGQQISEYDKRLKLRELVARTDTSFLGNEALIRTLNDANNRKNVEASLLLKYDVPATRNLDCKEALATLVDTVKNAHLQVLKYCNLSGNCIFNSEPDPSNIYYGDKSLTTTNFNPALDKMPAQSTLTPSNPNLSNIYDIGSFLSKLVESNNQILSQKNSNDYLNFHAPAQLDFNNNPYLTNGLSDTVQTQNNEEAFNKIHLNEKTQTNIQNSDKSNLLNGFPSFRQPVSTNQYYPWNNPNFQIPKKNIQIIPQNQGNSMNDNNDYLTYYSQPTSLNPNNFFSNSALNSRIYQMDTTNNKRFNIIDSNGIKRIINMPTVANNWYNPIPKLQEQKGEGYGPLNNNNNPNMQHEISQIDDDKSSSTSMFDQRNQAIKEHIQYEGPLIPSQEYNNPNYLAYMDPYQNQNIRPISNGFYLNENTKQNPYLTSVNVNDQNSFNYNFKQANAKVHSNFGINLYPQTNFVDYPKYNIYADKLFDSNRLSSVSNLVKLNTVADNEGIVELTYRLKRPQSLGSNPDYYVKFRMPYRDFVSKINDLFRNPYVRSNPEKLHQELLSISKLEETTPDLVDIQRDDASKLVLNNGGILVNAKVLSRNDSNFNEYLKTIQNLNANLNTTEILNLVQNDKTFVGNNSWDPSILIPYSGSLSHQNVNPQQMNHGNPLRVSHHTQIDELPIFFLPSPTVTDDIILNPTNPLMRWAILHNFHKYYKNNGVS